VQTILQLRGSAIGLGVDHACRFDLPRQLARQSMRLTDQSLQRVRKFIKRTLIQHARREHDVRIRHGILSLNSTRPVR